ncbi:hypothetical protein LCGC14_0420710 [marine sediment metagenome]|uniref:Phage major capsid protein n=1 Tax=marine sediment metagenome TaxID=412755 RepID=A0A0F9T935_9ZZZZ
MAIVGHFSSLSELRKLVISEMIAGVIEETIEVGQLLPMLPVVQLNSRSLIYNRENVLPSAAWYDIHQQISFTADRSITQKEVWLKRAIRQDLLDEFVMETYQNPNMYKVEILKSLVKGVARTVEDTLVYGSGSTEASTEFDGLDKLISIADGDSFSSATNLQAHDMGGASNPLTFRVLRELINAVRPRASILLMTRTMRDTLAAVAMEKGIVLSGAAPIATITHTPDQFGKMIDFFDGIPIVISDYLLQENDNTGGKDSGNDSGMSSIYAIRFGAIADGGLSLVVGGQTGGTAFFKVKELGPQSDFDADAIRLSAYVTLALGSTRALGRIHSIQEAGTIIG